MRVVRRENSSLVLQDAVDAVGPERGADVGVYGGERVVEEVDVCVGVAGAGEGDAGALAAGEVDPWGGCCCCCFGKKRRERKKGG